MNDVSIATLLAVAMLATSVSAGSDGFEDKLDQAVEAADVVFVGTVGDRYFVGGGGAIGVTIQQVIKGEYALGRTGVRWGGAKDAECQRDYLPEVKYIFLAKVIGSSLSISGFCKYVVEASDSNVDRLMSGKAAENESI